MITNSEELTEMGQIEAAGFANQHPDLAWIQQRAKLRARRRTMGGRVAVLVPLLALLVAGGFWLQGNNSDAVVGPADGSIDEQPAPELPTTRPTPEEIKPLRPVTEQDVAQPTTGKSQLPWAPTKNSDFGGLAYL